MTVTPLLQELFSRLEDPFTGEALFDCLVGLIFFIKNERGEYVVVNQEMVRRCGRRDKSDVLGRRPDEVHPAPLGASYRAQDEALLRTGEPVLNQLELQTDHQGSTVWCMTHKLPLRGQGGRIVGLVGISQDLQAPNEKREDFTRIARVISHIQSHFGDALPVADLAGLAGLSPYQLDQRIRRIFQLTIGQFILKVRMDAAIRRLRESGETVASIAQACGYSDQSAFTRQFHRTVGLTPVEFRRNVATRR